MSQMLSKSSRSVHSR